MTKKILITSALPYVNGDLHIGHFGGCLLTSDIYARFNRNMGRDVLYICGADEHGTPSIVGAMKEGISVKEYNEKFYQSQLKMVQDFKLSFDLYGRTHTEKQEKLVQSLFTQWDNAGLIEERIMKQPFSVDDNMFLADRQIKGTCPKCDYDNADGDQCEKCGELLSPSDLINPYSAISKSYNIELRDTKHLYFLYSKMQDKLKNWVDSRQGWPKTATSIAYKWINEGLQDTPISRDLNWGIPVNKPGFEDKVFYVWFDAPWGYVSISQYANENWGDWWKNPDSKYVQFMGKDNVSFHSVLFPAQQLALPDGEFKMVDILKASNFFNFEGAKISKSKGNGIFLDQALTFAVSDTWRYYLSANAADTDDHDFTIQRFADVINKDLNGLLGNFVSRVTKLTDKNFGLNVPESNEEFGDVQNKLNELLSELTDGLEKCEFRRATFALRSMWATANEFMSDEAPWALVKEGKETEAKAVLNECFQIIDFIARVSEPFMPDVAEKIQNIFENKKDFSWPDKYEHRIKGGESFTIPENLFDRIDDDLIEKMRLESSSEFKNAK